MILSFVVPREEKYSGRKFTSFLLALFFSCTCQGCRKIKMDVFFVSLFYHEVVLSCVEIRGMNKWRKEVRRVNWKIREEIYVRRKEGRKERENNEWGWKKKGGRKGIRRGRESRGKPFIKWDIRKTDSGSLEITNNNLREKRKENEYRKIDSAAHYKIFYAVWEKRKSL